MMNNFTENLVKQLDLNEKQLAEAKSQEEYSALLKERKNIIKKLNELGMAVMDDLSVSATPIFDK